jgi:endonuclease G, mitochondrial
MITLRITPTIGAVILLLASAAAAAEPCDTDMIYGGLPRWSARSREKITVLTNCAYIVGYSDVKKNPVWVAYHLRRLGPVGAHAKAPERKDSFRTDPRTAATVDDEAFDFANTKCDRGHMAPSYGIGSRYGANAQDETFFMSNMTPQKFSLNRGQWKKLEEMEADLFANGCEEVWVITGPIFKGARQLIRKSGVEIPDAFYKIVIDEVNGRPRALAFIMEQSTTSSRSMEPFLTSVDSIESLTGLDFLTELRNELEREIESFTPDQIWAFAD